MYSRGVASRTQQERTEATRSLLVDATLELLEEVGWAATTSVAVCERAELTRGALVHHFGDLPTLMAAALDAHYDRLVQSMAARPEPRSAAELVEQSWRVIDTGRFKIVIEAWLAAANDPALGASIGPVITRFAGLVHPARYDALLTDEHARTTYLAIREAMLGLALGRATAGGPLGHEYAVVERLTGLARTIDTRTGATT